jgi:hypothetical protein
MGLDPLSPWTYGRRNARKILPTLIILTFVVMLVLVTLSTLRGLKEATLVYAREFDHWTILFPKKNTAIPREVRERIAAHPAVERVIDSRNCFMRVRTLIGPVPYHLRAAKAEEMRFLLDRAGDSLRAGRLPEAKTNEVALHESLMRANGWELGAEFGMDKNEDEWMPGRFRVVGVLQGPTPMGLASFDFLNNPLLYSFAPKLWERLIVVPRPGRAGEVNAWLRDLEEVKVWDKARAIEEVSQGFDRILLVLDFVSLLLIVVVSLVVGLIHNIFFGQRMDEFAILLAIGHTRRRLFRKVASETGAIMACSWAAGMGLAIVLMRAFAALALSPRGIDLPLWQPGAILVSLLLPVVAQLFASATVLGRLRELDPVAIIERRG